MTPTSVLVSWTAWGGTQPIFYITNHRVTGNSVWIPNPLGLTQNLSQPITGLTGGTGYDVRVQGSNRLGVAFSAVFNFTTPAGGVVSRDVAVPAEWGGPKIIVRDVVAPAEFRPPAFVVARNVTANVEWTGPTGVTRDFAVPVESRTGVTFFRDAVAPAEWTGPVGVTRDAAAPLDINSTPLAPPLQVQNLALSLPTTTSLLASWDDLITGPSVQGYTLEWKRSTDPAGSFLPVVPSVPEPSAPFVVSRTVAVPLDYGGHVALSQDAVVPAEFISPKTATRDFPAVMDFGGALVIRADRTAPVEFSGSTKNVFRDFAVPHERRTSPRRDLVVGAEFRATPPNPPPAAFYVEIDLGDAQTITDPATGIVWGLSNQSGGIATMNSVPNAASAPTDILVRTFSPDVIWARDAAHPLLWRSWNGSSWVPAAGTSDPRFTNTPPGPITSLTVSGVTASTVSLAWDFPASGTVVGGGFRTRFKRTVDSTYSTDVIIPCVGPGVGQFVDTSGRVFSVSPAGQVVVNGVPDLTTSSVTRLLLIAGRYWYESAVSGPGPAASSAFLTADFTAPFGNPAGTGQQVVSQMMYGASGSTFADNNFADWGNDTYTTALATVSPGLYMMKSYAGVWNSDLSVNASAVAALVQNFYKADPLGVSKVWFCVQQAAIPSYTAARCGTAVGNLASYLFNYTMPDGRRFPIWGFSNDDEPDGRLSEASVQAQCQAMLTAVKAVSPNILVGGPETSSMNSTWASDLVAAVPTLDFLVYNCFNVGSQTGTPPFGNIAWNDTATAVVNMMPRYVSDAQFAAAVSGSSLKFVALAGYGMDWDCVVDAMNSHLGAVFCASVYINTHNQSRYPCLPCVWGGIDNGTGCIVTDPSQNLYGFGPTVQVTTKGYMMAQGRSSVYGPRWASSTNSGMLVMAVTPAPGQFGLMIVNAGQGGRSGQVALSHWPVNSSGSGTANVWQLTSTQNTSGMDGARSTVNVTAGLTATMTFPDPSVTIITSVSALPGAPTSLASPSQTTSSVSLTWTAPTVGTPPTSYRVQYKQSSSGTWLDGPNPTATSATVGSLGAGTSYDFRVHAINGAGNGPDSATLTRSTVASAAPARAAAVGYNTRTLGPSLILSGAGQNWLPSNEAGGPGSFTNNADGSVTILPPSNAGDGNQRITASATGGYMNFTGTVYGGGGYFVARMKWNNSNIDGAAWPAWWANDMEGHTAFGVSGTPCQWPGQAAGYNLWFEPDFMEQSRGETDHGSSLWNWYGTSGNPQGIQPVNARTSTANYNTYHSYGCLWVPATPTSQGYMAYDLDGVEYGRISWNYRADRNTLPAPPPTSNGTTDQFDSDLDWRHLYLILGSGPNAPITVLSVEVWQKDTSGNITK